MNIHEYQAKALLKSFGAPVADGKIARTAEEIRSACGTVPGPVWAVKSQIHAGGRGKGHFVGGGEGGGVRIARSAEDAATLGRSMLGRTLVTHQTGPSGQTVNAVYFESGAEIARELYLSLLVDGRAGQIAVVFSTEGGVDIESLAESSPERIHTRFVETGAGFTEEALDELIALAELEGDACAQFRHLLPALLRAFIEKDMSLLEINPLIVTAEGNLQLLDAKISFDSNALFRHPDIAALRDETEEDEREREAAEWDLAYIALDGHIGCMVNGAGLAMATMDIIKLHGTTPANFCDVGGGASAEKVAAAFRIIARDPRVRGILVNIFGGILQCDVLAKGVLAAVEETKLTVPLVVRLQGTRSDEGNRIINESGLNVIPAGDLDEAARKIVAAAR